MILPLTSPNGTGLIPPKPAPDATDKTTELFRLSQELEANFLAEMLKSSGINKTAESFGGGAGEDAFSSMLTQQYASKMAGQGGVGLAEHIYKSLVAAEDRS